MSASVADDRLLLDVRSLSKTFPGQVALDGASFHVRAGEIHALLGLNGSGKSTLIKVLTGYHREDPDSDVAVFGQRVSAHQVRALYPRRVAVLQQDLALLPGMSVAENMGLGSRFARTRYGRVRWSEQRELTRQACRRLGIDVDPRAPVAALDPSSRVLLALARAIRSIDEVDGALIFADEPTAALGRQDVERVFSGLRSLADGGAGVVVVSHRMEEVLEYCDSLTILRDGQTIVECPTAGLDKQRLATLLTGRADVGEHLGAQPGKPRSQLTLNGGRVPVLGAPPLLAVSHLRGMVVEDLSFEVARGEVLGIAGVVGSGREELGPLLVGAIPRSGGTVAVNGVVIGNAPRRAAQAGVGFVPVDRKRQALLATMSVSQNMTVNGEASRLGGLWLDHQADATVVNEWIERIRLDPPDPSRRVSLLSGGNQQKVVLARWLRLSPRVMVLDDPMQGVDIASKEAIFRIIRQTTEEGCGVVLISSDATELADAADRVLVLRGGHVGAELAGDAATTESIIMEVEG
jgi:ribose transport system ATP-binding protein